MIEFAPVIEPLVRRRSAALSLLAILASLILVPGCNDEEEIPPNVVVTVGSRMITTSDFDRYLQRNPGVELAQIAPEAASALLDQYIEQILLSEYAVTRKIEIPTEKIAEAVRNDPGSTMVEKQDQLRSQRLETEVATAIEPPAESVVRRFYDDNPAEFDIDETVHVRHILVHEREVADEVASKLRAGEDFADLSVEHSASPNASRGGDIGFVHRGELPKVFEESIFSLNEGETSAIIETGLSFHIFKVEERLPAGRLSFERAAPVIVDRLIEESRSDALADVIRTAHTVVQVRVLSKRLTFEYTGTFPRHDNE